MAATRLLMHKLRDRLRFHHEARLPLSVFKTYGPRRDGFFKTFPPRLTAR